MAKRKKTRARQQPKRISILKKSKHMQRWFLRNPWIRPMCVFNYAAIKIQQHFRGFPIRKYGVNSVKLARKSSKRSSNKQLDKYLQYLDRCRTNGIIKPLWLEGGYSSWCIVRMQALWRGAVLRNRLNYKRKLVDQVAAIIIQTAWRNAHYRNGLIDTPKKREFSVNQAVLSMQHCWRAYCNKRIYHYFRDLIMIKLKGAPNDLLRTIIPNEADLLDRASGVHVRFRLGSPVFPPKVYFKIYTHRPLCDVNSFAPRDYTSETKIEGTVTHNKVEFVDKKAPKAQTIRVGTRYFGTLVSTTCKEGTRNWYKRDECNNWRAIASKLFENILAPPWYQETAFINKPQPFHYSRLRRQIDLMKHKKRRRREWMVKAYMMASSSYPESELNRKRDIATPPSGLLKQMSSFNEEISSGRGSKNDYPVFNDSPPTTAANSSKPSSPFFDFPSPTKIKTGGSGYMAVRDLKAEEMKKTGENDIDGITNLIDWSLALNFDSYTRDWTSMGTSMPSDALSDVMYHYAASTNKDLSDFYHGK